MVSESSDCYWICSLLRYLFWPVMWGNQGPLPKTPSTFWSSSRMISFWPHYSRTRILYWGKKIIHTYNRYKLTIHNYSLKDKLKTSTNTLRDADPWNQLVTIFYMATQPLVKMTHSPEWVYYVSSIDHFNWVSYYPSGTVSIVLCHEVLQGANFTRPQQM